MVAAEREDGTRGELPPLLIHHHLAKNAGTSLRQVLQANFTGDQLFENYSLSVWTEPRQWWAEWYRSLGARERERLRCVGSHSAQLLLPVVDDRPVRALCVLRDPVDRVTSLYRYALQQTRWLRDTGSQARTGRLAQAILSRGWTLKDIYRELGGSEASPELVEFQLFFNGQARELLSPFVDVMELPLSPGLDRLERHRRLAFEALNDHYLVGAQDRFSQSVRMFADRLGWRKAFLPRTNVGRDSAAGERIDEETRELIQTHNTLDAELHGHYSELLAPLPPVSRLSQRRWLIRRGVRRATKVLRHRLRVAQARALRVSRG